VKYYFGPDRVFALLFVVGESTRNFQGRAVLLDPICLYKSYEDTLRAPATFILTKEPRRRVSFEGDATVDLPS
jgi:hypothetical protein